MSEITETLYVTNPKDWRKWLEKNHDKKSEIWLVLPKKSSGKPKISYNDSVEQALCFGWIDSIQKPLDTDTTVQRFTPRKNHGYFSQPNIERLRHLAETNQLIPSVLDATRTMLGADFVFPKDIMQALQKQPAAYGFFEKCSPSYQRIRVAYVEGARDRPEEFEKRLKNLVNISAQGKKIMGHGGIDKYY